METSEKLKEQTVKYINTAADFRWSSIIGVYSRPEVYAESYEKFILFPRTSRPGKLVENVTLIRDDEDVKMNNEFVLERIRNIRNVSFKRKGKDAKSDLDTDDKLRLWLEINKNTPLREEFESDKETQKPFFDACVWNKIGVPKVSNPDPIHARDIQIDMDAVISGGLDAELSHLSRMGMNRG